MRIKKICFSSFRNILDGEFEPSEKINVLCGSNAQGKTNILEALWLFTGSRSFRGSKDSELLKFDRKKGQLELEFEAFSRNQQSKITLEGSRNVSLNGVSLDSPLKLSGEFCAVIFSPEHLGLVKEGPQLRRKFIDAAVCQIMPRHISSVLEYHKALAQRNSLLKDIPYHAQLMDTLDIWDEKLSKAGAAIIFTRLRYLKKLSEKACSIYAGIAKNNETLELDYLSSENIKYQCDLNDRLSSIGNIANTLYSEIGKTRSSDLESGYTHVGPHRDDLQIKISGLSARSFGSQGQQRTAVLALKLAEASVICDTIGEPPVLLLDDVMSELDGSRQDYLLNHIDGMQVFITCCDPAVIGNLKNGSGFEIKAGTIHSFP